MMDMPKKKKRAPVKGWQLISSLLLVLIAGGVLVYVALIRPAVGLVELGESYNQKGDEARDHIEAVLGTKLPDGAGSPYFSGVEWMDYSYWMRFSVPAEQFDALLKDATRLCFTEPLDVNADATLASGSTGLDWWTPEAATSHLTGNCGSNPYYNILVDTGDPATWTVYLNVFST